MIMSMYLVLIRIIHIINKTFNFGGFMKKLLFSAVIIAMFAGIFALNSDNMTCIGRTLFGNPNQVKVHGGHLYFTAGNTFVCADISDSTEILPVSWVNAYGETRGFDFYGNYAFVTDSSDGFFIVDISDPSNLNVVSHITVSNCLMRDAAVTDTILCIANGAQNNTLFYNITDPVNPDSLSVYWTNGSADAVYAAGTLAFQTEWAWGLSVLDISDPSNVSRLFYPNAVTTLHDVSVSGIYTYLAAHTNGFYILSNEDTANMYALKGTYNTAGYATGLAIQDSNAYVADWANGLVILDISDKASPSNQGTYDGGYSIGSVTISGANAYTSSYIGGIRSIGVTDKTTPVSQAFMPTYGNVSDILVSGDYIYMANEHNGVAVITLGDTLNPDLTHSGMTPDYITGLFQYSDTLYASTTDGIARYDISTRNAPVYIDKPYTDSAYALEGNSSNIFVGTYINSIKALNRTNLTELCDYAPGGAVYDLKLRNDTLYAACWDAGLDIIDVSNPDSLKSIGSIALSGALGVAVEGDYAYVSGYNNFIYIIDISDRTNPVQINTISTTESWDVEVSNDTLYFADANNGVYVYNVTDKMNPVSLGYYEVPGKPVKLTLDNGLIYTGAQKTGLWIFKMNDPAGIDVRIENEAIINSIILESCDIMNINVMIKSGEYNAYSITGRRIAGIDNTGVYFLKDENGSVSKLTVIR